MFITVIQKKYDELVLVRFQRRGKVLHLVRGARYPLAEEELAVEEVLSSWSAVCRDDRIILALPPGILAIRELDLPVSDRKRCREILPLELKGELAVDSDALVYEAFPMAGGKIAAIWAGRELLQGELQLLSEQGFDAEVITFSMFNWQTLLPEDSSGSVAVTDGESVAIFQDRRPLFFRALPKDDGRALEATITAVELAKGVTVDKVFTLGSHVAETTRPVSSLPMGNSALAAFPGDAAAAFDLAAEYAMAHELVSGNPVNLRRGTLCFTKAKDRLRKKLRLTYALAASLLVLVFAEAGVRYLIASKQLTSLDRSIKGIYKEVFPTRAKAVDEVSELKAEIKKIGAVGSDGMLTVLKKLTDAKGDDAREVYEVDFDGAQVTGRGYDRSVQGVSEFKTRALLQFRSFEVSEIKSRPDGSVSFTFRATLKGGGK